MKKYILLSMVIIFGLIGFFVKFNQNNANNSTEKGWVMGITSENIEGLAHDVEYHYGSPFFNTLQTMLDNLKITIYPEDKIEVFPDPSLKLGSRIIIKRANPIIINDAEVDKTYRTWKTTVGDLLEEKKIVLGEKDLLNPNKETSLKDFIGGEKKIVITRVSVTQIKEKEEIVYKTITKEDANLDRGVTKIEQRGKKGVKELTYEVKRKNGKEVSKKLIKSEITRDPQDKIVIKGTKVVVYGTGKATWYDWISGMTAAHNTLPMGTMVHVVNLENGKSVDVKIVDRGIQGEAVIDLSDDAFRLLAPLGKGTIQVRMEKP